MEETKINLLLEIAVNGINIEFTRMEYDTLALDMHQHNKFDKQDKDLVAAEDTLRQLYYERLELLKQADELLNK